jgi:hypothetical protein
MVKVIAFSSTTEVLKGMYFQIDREAVPVVLASRVMDRTEAAEACSETP